MVKPMGVVLGCKRLLVYLTEEGRERNVTRVFVASDANRRAGGSL